MTVFNITNSGNVTGGPGDDTLNLTYNTTTNGVWLTGMIDNPAGGYDGRFDGYVSNDTNFTGIENFGFTDLSGGNDNIHTGAGNDVLNGGGGNDELHSGSGDDSVDGGAGIDLFGADLSGESKSFTVNLNTVSTLLTGTVQNVEAFKNFATGSGNDTITNHMTAGIGDSLSTGKGNDTIKLYSGGTDTVDAGLGKNDRLILIYQSTTNGVALTGKINNPNGGYDGRFDGYVSNDTNFTGVEHFTFIDKSGGNDNIHTGDGNDRLLGGGGNDVLDGGSGRDVMNGGAGVDTYMADQSALTTDVVINLNKISKVNGAAVRNFEAFGGVTTGSGNDTITNHRTAKQGDTIATGAGNDQIILRSGGTDQIDGGTGSDRLSLTYDSTTNGVVLTGKIANAAGGYDGRFDGYVSNDTNFTGIEHFTFIDKSGGNDNIHTGDGNDRLLGGGGNDVLDGGSGRDVMNGGAGVDTYMADQSALTTDVVINLNTVSTVNGAKVRNFEAFGGVTTGSGNDTITNHRTAKQADIVATGGGNDTIILRSGGTDQIDGGTGSDRLSLTYDSTTNGVVLTGMIANAAGGYDGRFDGYVGNDTNFTGIEHFTFIDKSGGNDNIHTGDGNDRLLGGGGNDVLDGGSGRDEINGGAGNDTLTGGLGLDTFVFGNNGGSDRITDFNAASNGEDIDLSGVRRIKSFFDLKTHHMTQVGADVVIDDGAGTVITVESTLLADMTKGDFLF